MHLFRWCMTTLEVNNGHQVVKNERKHLYTMKNAVVAIRLFHHCSHVVLVLTQRKEKKYAHVKDLTPQPPKKGEKNWKGGGTILPTNISTIPCSIGKAYVVTLK